jgi:hypothetical protein
MGLSKPPASNHGAAFRKAAPIICAARQAPINGDRTSSWARPTQSRKAVLHRLYARPADLMRAAFLPDLPARPIQRRGPAFKNALERLTLSAGER